MRLATASKVLLTMGITENAGSLLNAAQALDISFSLIEGLLETSFAQEHRADFFDTIDGELCLRLTNMFVDTSTIVVRRSINGDPLLTAEDGELVEPSEYFADGDKGLVTFRKQPVLGHSQISVAYDSGIALADGEEEVLDAPQWLQDCAVAAAIQTMNILPSSPANRKDKSVGAVAAELRLATSQLLNARKRPRMVVTFPSLSLLDE